jgi:hypothetical protein
MTEEKWYEYSMHKTEDGANRGDPSAERLSCTVEATNVHDMVIEMANHYLENFEPTAWMWEEETFYLVAYDGPMRLGKYEIAIDVKPFFEVVTAWDDGDIDKEL